MTSIFTDFLQDCMEVFMDNFTMYAKCMDTNLMLNFEKCHFMVTEGIVLGHFVSNRGIKVDKSKIDIITSLPNPAFMLEVHSFLGHVGFFRRFIKNFNKIALLLSKLLQKDVDLNFLTSLEYPFELMCDASNITLGAILGQRAGVGK
ncbi:Retrovirus-related Pol polyprotein from transposon 17.6, partial [Mucuna pruriens]